jgi:hypothetical protein
MGPSNRRRRLDGTIPGVRRLGNLLVPFRLSPWWGGGWLNPKWVPIPTAVAMTSISATSSAVRFEGAFLTLAHAAVEREKQRKQSPIMLGRPDIGSALRLPKCGSKYELGG